MSDPYRTAGDVGKRKLPRIVVESDGKRLVQMTEASFTIESAIDRIDSMGMSHRAWVAIAEIKEPKPSTPEEEGIRNRMAAFGIFSTDGVSKAVARWLVDQIARLSP